MLKPRAASVFREIQTQERLTRHSWEPGLTVLPKRRPLTQGLCQFEPYSRNRESVRFSIGEL